MGFGAKPQWVGNEGEALPPYSPELAVSEGLGAKLWCVQGITILLKIKHIFVLK